MSIIRNYRRVKNYLFFLFYCPLFYSCLDAEEKTKQQMIQVDSFVGDTVEVRTELSEYKHFDYVIESNGKIKSEADYTVLSEGQGAIVQCEVKAGMMIAKGNLIAKVESTPLEMRMERAKLVRFNSQKEYESQLLGYESLFKNQTAQSIDTIKQKLRVNSGLAGAEQDIKEITYELSRSFIRSPINGMIADIKIKQGEVVRNGQEIARIYDPLHLTVEIKILEVEIPFMKSNAFIEVIPFYDSSLRYKASISEIIPLVDEAGMNTVRLRLSGTQTLKQVYPGMNCYAKINIPTIKAIVVPKSAVVIREGKTIVFTMENGQAIWHYVTTGKENNKEIVILQGLPQGKKVIVENNQHLINETPVQERKIIN